MWLSLFSTIFILLITFMQAIQGMFSAMIMAVLSVLSAATAFALVEPAYAFASQHISPEYAYGVCFLFIFSACLVVTRLLADWLIPGNMNFPLVVDRVGGACFGLIAGLVVVGSVAVGIQMLPSKADFMGFNRVSIVDGELQRRGDRFVQNGLWFRPDGFTVAAVSAMAQGGLAGATPMDQLHPDWLEEIQWNRSGVQKESRHTVPANSLKVQAVWNAVRGIVDDRFQAVDPEPGYKFIVVRASLDRGAADSDRKQRFTALQWRLVGQGRRGYLQVPLTAMSKPGKLETLALLGADEPVVFDAGAGAALDLIFEIPAESFTPLFVEYKRDARVELTKAKWTDQPLAPIRSGDTGAAEDTKDTPAPSRSSRRGTGGRVSGRTALPSESRFSNDMPVPIPADQVSSRNARVSGDTLEEGHFVVAMPSEQAGDNAITKFSVPKDKRLLQLVLEPQFAKSMFGRARQTAVKAIKQYYVQDDKGNTYFPIGECRVATLDGERTMEMQYWPNYEQPERALREPIRVKEQMLAEDDSQLTYLFLTEPGARIVEFSTGVQARDKAQLNLAAPE